MSEVDIGNGSCNGEFLLCAKTRDDNLVDGVEFLLCHLYVDNPSVAFNQHAYGFVAQVREHQRLVLLHLDGVFTVDVGDGTQSLGIFHGDANANKGFSCGVGYCSRYFQLFLC